MSKLFCKSGNDANCAIAVCASPTASPPSTAGVVSGGSTAAEVDPLSLKDLPSPPNHVGKNCLKFGILKSKLKNPFTASIIPVNISLMLGILKFSKLKKLVTLAQASVIKLVMLKDVPPSSPPPPKLKNPVTDSHASVASCEILKVLSPKLKNPVTDSHASVASCEILKLIPSKPNQPSTVFQAPIAKSANPVTIPACKLNQPFTTSQAAVPSAEILNDVPSPPSPPPKLNHPVTVSHIDLSGAIISTVPNQSTIPVNIPVIAFHVPVIGANQSMLPNQSPIPVNTPTIPSHAALAASFIASQPNIAAMPAIAAPIAIIGRDIGANKVAPAAKINAPIAEANPTIKVSRLGKNPSSKLSIITLPKLCPASIPNACFSAPINPNSLMSSTKSPIASLNPCTFSLTI